MSFRALAFLWVIVIFDLPNHAAGQLAGTSGDSNLNIVSNGQTNAVVVVSPVAKEWEAKVAADLAQFTCMFNHSSQVGSMDPVSSLAGTKEFKGANVGEPSAGTLNFSGSLDVSLGLGIDLSNPASPKPFIDKSSHFGLQPAPAAMPLQGRFSVTLQIAIH